MAQLSSVKTRYCGTGLCVRLFIDFKTHNKQTKRQHYAPPKMRPLRSCCHWKSRSCRLAVLTSLVVFLVLGTNIRWSLQLENSSPSPIEVALAALDEHYPGISSIQAVTRAKSFKPRTSQPSTFHAPSKGDDETMLVQPTDSIYARNHQNDTSRDFSPVVLEDFKLVFFVLPPATLWKRLFRRMMGYSDWNTKDPHDPATNGLKYLRDYSLSDANVILTSPKYTRAIFVRDPLERFFKVFHETVVPQNGEYVRKKCCPQQQQQQQQQQKQEERDCFSSRHNVTPEKFLNFLGKTKCRDIRWASIAEHMESKYWKHHTINFVGHWDRVDKDSQTLLEKLGVWNMFGASGWGKDGKLSLSTQLMAVYQPRRRWQRIQPFYNDTSREILVNQVYRQDYDLFGFTRHQLVQKTDYVYERNVLRWDAAPVVVERFRLVFFTVPKNACTTWKMLFRRMNGARNYQDQDDRRGLPHDPTRNGLRYLWDYSLEEANRIMTSPAYTRAIFVRDPRDRFMSAYLDKAVAYTTFLQRKCCRNTTGTINASQSYQELACSGQVPQPGQFLDLIHQCTDEHWLPQHYRMEEKYWPFITFVGHHDRVAVDAKRLLEQIGAWEEYGQQGWGSNLSEPIFHKKSHQRVGHATDSKQKYHLHVTPELEKQINDFYAVDFKNPKLGFLVDRP